MRRNHVIVIIFAWVVVGGIAGGVWYYTRSQLTPPTSLSQNPANLAAMVPPGISPPVIAFDQPGGATSDYRQAVAEYSASPQTTLDFARDPEGDPPAPLQRLLNAAGRPSAGLFIFEPGKIIDYQSEHTDLIRAEALGHCLTNAGLMLTNRKKMDDAKTYAKAAYCFGKCLYDERLTHQEYQSGLSIVDEAMVVVADAETEPRKSDLLKFETAMRDYDANHVQPIQDAIFSADDDQTAVHAGDVRVFAMQSSERMFRVEATLALGRMRFNAIVKGDQLEAEKLLKTLAADDDPAVVAAAAAAQGLTLEQYRMIH